ncbi:MAG: DMT family transporter [Thermoanaerobaculia bacterium]|nr:DMT family transporter [Thermoanaerobaculia bacterium]
MSLTLPTDLRAPITQHRVALAQAAFVTVLWSTSWVLIKFGLEAMPPLVFAGLRYGLASLVLWVALISRPEKRRHLRTQSVSDWLAYSALGLVLYALTQGGQFVALSLLPATVLSLALSCTPILVTTLSVPILGEAASPRQVAGVLIFLVGAWLYLETPSLESGFAPLGLLAAAICVAANAAGSLLGRRINRPRPTRSSPDALVVTTASMTVGSAVLLIAGFAAEPWPSLTPRSWSIVAWLAVVNTAVAFTLWNRSLRHLTATESSVVNNTMLIQIAILAALFLGEPVSLSQGLGLAAATVGTLLVQLRAQPRVP